MIQNRTLRFECSGRWCCVVRWIVADVAEDVWPSEHQQVHSQWHGVTSQNTWIFSTITVTASEFAKGTAVYDRRDKQKCPWTVRATLCYRMTREHRWCASVREVCGSCRACWATTATVDRATTRPYLAQSLLLGAGSRRPLAVTLSGNQRSMYGEGED
jgi:hypothetical protein